MFDEKAWRQEVRQWLEANAPRSLRETSASGPFDGYWGGKKHPPVTKDMLAWRDIAVKQGWTAPHWPREYGGAALSIEQTRIIWEEMRALGLPRPVVGFGFAMIGPILLQFGNEEQKREHLPRICRAEVRWCQGYSEPNAGSDLANLQLRAERVGDEFVLNGQKVWTSHADKCDWIFCLVRTNSNLPRKQQGITFILVDMESKGVTPRNIELISGASPFCETFFENVHVPLKNVIGQVDDGWRVAKALLGHERSMIGQNIGRQPGSAQRELVQSARRFLKAPEGTLPDPILRDDIAGVSMREAAFQLLLTRVEQQVASGAPGSESSVIKVIATELKQDRYELGVRIAGLGGLGWSGEGFAEDDLAYTREWLRTRANTIEGGTSEIQLNIIAKHVLGLPDA